VKPVRRVRKTSSASVTLALLWYSGVSAGRLLTARSPSSVSTPNYRP
jgi:hypothetical protein